MAVLGVGGRLELRREAPEACVIYSDDINIGSDTATLHCEGYWPGDKVVISGPDGLPIFIDGVPQCWDCVASYRQGVLYVARNRDQISDNDDQFYKSASEEYITGEAGTDSNTPKTETAWFYYRGENQQDFDDGPGSSIEGYLCIDSLDRISLYRDRCSALSCCGDPLFSWSENAQILDFDFVVINPFGSGEYQNAILACLGEIGEYIYNDVCDDDSVDPDHLVTSICKDPPLYLKPVADTPEYDNADVQPRGNVNQGPHPLWVVMCEIREYTLNLDAPSVDTTGVGEKWGNSVKSLVSGGGSVEFFIDRTCLDETTGDARYIMRLLLMTQKGAKAHAKFFLISDDCETSCSPCSKAGCAPELRGSLWYETDIYITQNAINVRPTEILAGSAQFVTTGEIKLLEGDPI